MAAPASRSGDGGDFLSTSAGGVGLNYIARWDGATWAPIGGGVNWVVRSLATLPNGDLVAGGQFGGAGNVAASRLARWDGLAWSALDDGVNDTVHAIAPLPTGGVAVGGNFTIANGQSSSYFARYISTCPAIATVAGSGCAGAAGLNTLAATALPWLGATFRARGAGLLPGSIALVVGGASLTALPLGSLVQPTPANCQLLVDPQTFEVKLVPASGQIESALSVPNQPALIGQVVRQQVVAIEIDAAGAFAQFTSSNALSVTVGAF